VTEKEKKIIRGLARMIEELQDEIDIIHESINPPVEIITDSEDNYTGPTAQIPVDVYEKIIKYLEDKDLIFMGVA
tara:strand:- start:103 stop:327 length:225 start_codon:yes stop_codon:yes gene_type:complete